MEQQIRDQIDWPQPFPPEEYADRRARLQAALGAAGLDAILVTEPRDLAYLTGYDQIWQHHRGVTGLFFRGESGERLFFDSEAHRVVVATTPEIGEVLYHPRGSGQDQARFVADELTARGWDRGRIAAATIEEALRHPNWDMGAKITIDSASLMNKGLEVIEARWLFGTPPEEIDVVVHPESIVHSWVEFVDGSVIAQLGAPDMRGPIALALTWPERLPLDVPRLDLAALGRLHFEAPDRERFPCLDLAFEALRGGEAAPAALNAANEVAVAAFLAGGIAFPGIPAVNGQVLESFMAEAGDRTLRDLDDVLEVDAWARRAAEAAVRDFGGAAPVSGKSGTASGERSAI